MTVNERIDDIKKRTGYSENVIRRVLTAEAESALESLKKGERVTLINRVALIPEVHTRFDFSGNKLKFLTAKATVLGSMNDKLAEYSDYVSDESDVPDGIVTTQINALN